MSEKEIECNFTVKVLYDDGIHSGHYCVGCQEYWVKKPKKGTEGDAIIEMKHVSNGNETQIELLPEPDVPNSPTKKIYVMNRFGKTIDVI